MEKVFKPMFFTGAIVFLAVLLTSGMASAQTVSVGPTATYSGGNPPTVDIDATIDCQTHDAYILEFEATQNQGRFEGVAFLQGTCSDIATAAAGGPLSLNVFDGFKKFRAGPLTLLVRIFDDANPRAFVKGLGFYLKGK